MGPESGKVPPMSEIEISRGPRKYANFTIVSNAVLDDGRLTFRARGVLCNLLGKPGEWSSNADTLARQSPGEGRDAMRSVLRELESVGYLIRTKWRDPETQRWRARWELFDEPQEKNPHVEPGRVSSDGFPATDNQRRVSSDGKPATESQSSLIRTQPRTQENSLSRGADLSLADRRSAIDSCDLCDVHGYDDRKRVCDHDPDAMEINSRGMGRVREVLAKRVGPPGDDGSR